MTNEITALALPIDDEPMNDWEWEIYINADIVARLKRLESKKFTRFELYEEILELLAVVQVYWGGMNPERQQETAKDIRDVFRRLEALKARIQNWAHKQIARRIVLSEDEKSGWLWPDEDIA
jgi:hypothetical protein